MNVNMYSCLIPHQNAKDSQALSMNIQMVKTGHTLCADCAFLLGEHELLWLSAEADTI